LLLGSDGDNVWLPQSQALVGPFCDYVKAEPVPNVVLFAMTEIPGFRTSHMHHFSDPHHLAKRIEYYLISKELQFVPHGGPVIGPALVGQVLSAFLCDPSWARKMEDKIALQVFSKQTVLKTLNAADKNPDFLYLLFALLPPSLMFAAILDPDLTRADRIANLLLALSLVQNYRDFVEEAYRNRGRDWRAQDNKLPFPEAWAQEFISVVLGLIYELLSSPLLHLGAGGSHFIEHFFALIRRMCCNDESHEAFMRNFWKVAAKMRLLTELHIDAPVPPRRSDSGCRLRDSEADLPGLTDIPAVDIWGQSLQFLSLCGEAHDSSMAKLARIDQARGYPCPPLDLGVVVSKLHEPGQTHKLGMRGEGYVSVGGLGNDKRRAGASQLAALARPETLVVVEVADEVTQEERYLGGDDDGGAVELDQHPDGVEPRGEDIELPEEEQLAADMGIGDSGEGRLEEPPVQAEV
jgi:hypothetical protein